jgi:hypothetical protein
MKMCQLEFYWFYFDPYMKFDDLIVYELNALESLMTSKNLPMNWCIDLNGEELDCPIIELDGSKFAINQCCFIIGYLKLVLKPNFPLVMARVKPRCEKSTKALMDELQGEFLNHELMSTLGVIYPNFCVQNLDNVGDVFPPMLDFYQGCLL